MVIRRRFPIGAEVFPQGVHFRVWGPNCQSLDLNLEDNTPQSMSKDEKGYFSFFSEKAKPGMRYQFRIDQTLTVPDPASRYQPQGPHGPSEIIDPSIYPWTDQDWKGVDLPGQVIYEFHVGTFTPEGTWQAAIHKLPYLKELGVTILEMMPIADFAGKFGWGYDGVNLFAPYHIYGTPHDLRQFIDKAHALNLSVILDVVYNHFGPDGNYLEHFSSDYHNEKYTTEWGKPINYDGKNAASVREFFIANAGYWIEEYHFDGLRLDATQNIYDSSSSSHILSEIVNAAHAKARGKSILIFAENESQESHLIDRCDQGGYGIDSVWNDDFHHASVVRLSGLREAYYTDYQGHLQEIISALKYGYLYQGQYYSWQKKNRGTPSLNNAYHKYVHYLQNHDQIANSSTSLRIHQFSNPSFLRIFILLLLLSPQIPLLFQGQEFAASSPFYFFADHPHPLARSVWEGRKQFLLQYPSFNNEKAKNLYADPCDEQTFLKCKLLWEEAKNSSHLIFYQHLLHLRAKEMIFTKPRYLDGSVINEYIMLLRFFGNHPEEDRLILCNFGPDYSLESIAEPLFAPPFQKTWNIAFSTQDIMYGGTGTSEQLKTLQGHIGLVLKSI